jgi:hypothetical protein
MIDPYRAEPGGIAPVYRILLFGIVLGATADEALRLVARAIAWLAGGM